MTETILFVLLDAEYDIKSINGRKVPIICLWGRSEEKRIEVQVKGFLPYFYAEANEEEIQNIFSKEKDRVRKWIIHTTSEEKRLFFGGSTKKVTKITGNLPYLVPELRKLLQNSGIVVHESDIPFTRRFLIDRDLKALHTLKVTGNIIREEKDGIIIEASCENILRSPDISSDYHPIVLAFDIEVDEHGETIHELLSEKKRRITAISMVWGTLETEMPSSNVLILQEDSDESEIKLLENFVKIVNEVKPDIFLSFNGTFFDIPYLQSRMQKYTKSLGKLAIFDGLQEDIIKSQIPVESYRLKGRAVVDLLPRTWGIHPISGKKNLDNIAEQVLGEKKIQINKGLGQLWRNGIQGIHEDYQLFSEYSLKDALLTFRLGIELGVLDDIELCRISGYPLPEGILSTSRNIGELGLMRLLYSRNLLIPSKPSKAELRRRNELKRKHPHLGGWVIDPTVDEAIFVAILDFRSLYPNIVRQHNISGETLKPNSEEMPPENRFKDKPRGAIAELMNLVLNQRYNMIEEITRLKNQPTNEGIKIRIKLLENKQKSLKLMTNSLLGASNYPRGRFYHHLLSNSITGIARTLLSEKLDKWSKDFSKRYNYEVFLRYGDTDSIFVEFQLNLDPLILKKVPHDKSREKELQKLLTAINEYRSFLTSQLPEYLELILEDIALRIILKKGRKKAYAYQSLLTQEIIIKGFEAIRSDWSPLAKKTQRKLLETLLSDFSDDREVKAKKNVFDSCRSILRKSVSDLIPELSIRGPLRRSPAEYRSKTPAVGAFLHYCEENGLSPDLEWKKWDGFPYIIAKGPLNQPQYHRAFHPNVFRRGEKKIDKMHYIKEILGASSRFGIQISENEAQQGAFIIPLTVFFN